MPGYARRKAEKTELTRKEALELLPTYMNRLIKFRIQIIKAINASPEYAQLMKCLIEDPGKVVTVDFEAFKLKEDENWIVRKIILKEQGRCMAI